MKQVLVVVGPTGIGKSKEAIALAKAFDGEIISGDAYQVYKELSIGTAKVTKEEMDGVVHHLVDTLSIKDPYNVKIFQEVGRACIEDIHRRGKLPIICGGTGLYIKALLYDYEFEEENIDMEYRQHLQDTDNETLYAMLQEVDAKSAKEIHPNNKQRMMRAIEIARSGKSKSEKEEAQQHTLCYDAYLIGLTMSRDKLYEKINQRVNTMIQKGLKEEIESLNFQEEDWELQSLQSIGYKEWKSYFLGNISEEDVVQAIQKHTRNFAKRQYTWFRNQLDVHWYDVCDENCHIVIQEDVKEWLGNNKTKL